MWTRDGRELIYRPPAAAGGVALTLASVEVTAGAGFAWGDETVFAIPGAVSFFGFRDYDLMPDGERFVVLVADDASQAAREASRPTVQVATNWSELIKERVAAP